jgi:hypothetical protein
VYSIENRYKLQAKVRIISDCLENDELRLAALKLAPKSWRKALGQRKEGLHSYWRYCNAVAVSSYK